LISDNSQENSKNSEKSTSDDDASEELLDPTDPIQVSEWLASIRPKQSKSSTGTLLSSNC
jgi:hypothetical protein